MILLPWLNQVHRPSSHQSGRRFDKETVRNISKTTLLLPTTLATLFATSVSGCGSSGRINRQPLDKPSFYRRFYDGTPFSPGDISHRVFNEIIALDDEVIGSEGSTIGKLNGAGRLHFYTVTDMDEFLDQFKSLQLGRLGAEELDKQIDEIMQDQDEFKDDLRKITYFRVLDDELGDENEYHVLVNLNSERCFGKNSSLGDRVRLIDDLILNFFSLDKYLTNKESDIKYKDATSKRKSWLIAMLDKYKLLLGYMDKYYDRDDPVFNLVEQRKEEFTKELNSLRSVDKARIIKLAKSYDKND